MAQCAVRIECSPNVYVKERSRHHGRHHESAPIQGIFCRVDFVVPLPAAAGSGISATEGGGNPVIEAIARPLKRAPRYAQPAPIASARRHRHSHAQRECLPWPLSPMAELVQRRGHPLGNYLTWRQVRHARKLGFLCGTA